MNSQTWIHWNEFKVVIVNLYDEMKNRSVKQLSIIMIKQDIINLLEKQTL